MPVRAVLRAFWLCWQALRSRVCCRALCVGKRGVRYLLGAAITTGCESAAEEGCASRGQIGRLHQKAAVRCGFGLFKAAEMVHTRPWPHQDASRRHQHGIRAVREAVCRSFQARTGVFARNQRRLRGCIAGRSLRCRAASANKAKPDDDALRREVAARVRLHGGRGSGAVSARAYCRGMGAGIPGRRSASSPATFLALCGSESGMWLRPAERSDRGVRKGMQDAARERSPPGLNRLPERAESAVWAKRRLCGAVLACSRLLKWRIRGLGRTRMRSGATSTEYAPSGRPFAAVFRQQSQLLPENVLGAEPSGMCFLPSLEPAAAPCGLRGRVGPSARMSWKVATIAVSESVRRSCRTRGAPETHLPGVCAWIHR